MSVDNRFRFEVFGEADALEWENRVGRSSPDYIKWVQKSLNQIMGLRLTVDGNPGPQTRSAIRSFQQKQGLVADGIIGERTEAALRNAAMKMPTPATQPTQAPVAVGPDKIFFGLDYAVIDENRNPNWEQAKAQGLISFAIIRANYGNWTDSTFKRDWGKMKDAGIVRGAYLFLRFPHPPTKSWFSMTPPSPATQAQAFINAVGPLNESDLPPSLDVEFTDGRAVTGMNARQCLDWVRAAWNVLKNHYRVAPIIYTSGRVWNEDLNNLAVPEFIESPLWLAKYCWRRKDRSIHCPFPNKGKAVLDRSLFASGQLEPDVPPMWGDSTNWWIHQYQGDARQLPGFNQVDLNRFNALQKGASGNRVKWVQRRLGIAQSGQFDETMERSLRAFQTKKGLLSNGIIDPRTFAYLCWSNP